MPNIMQIKMFEQCKYIACNNKYQTKYDAICFVCF